jgi:uncharacterized membrane protein YfcA
MSLRPVEWGLLILFLGVALAGVLVRVFDGSMATAAGMLVGSILGASVGIWISRRETARRRLLDEQRLDADLDD